MTFGEKLRKYRTDRGLTQSELAEMIGLKLNTISNYEKGKTYPQNREVYSRLADALGVDQYYLYNENEEFIAKAASEYGKNGKKQAEDLVAEFGGLFAGGSLSESEKDGVMLALQEIYWECKKENIAKYGPSAGSKADS